MRSCYSVTFPISLSVIVLTKPGGKGEPWVCSWCNRVKTEWVRADSWWRWCDAWTLLRGLIILLAWLCRWYSCTGGKMSCGGTVGDVVAVSSSSYGEMKFGVDAGTGVWVCWHGCGAVWSWPLKERWAWWVQKGSCHKLSIEVISPGCTNGLAWSEILEMVGGLEYVVSNEN